MQLYTSALFLAYLASTIATPVSSPAAGDLALSSHATRGVCGTGFTITTFGSTGCGKDGQGDSNSGKDCSVCVQMGDAQSWLIRNPDHCSTMAVSYYANADCTGGDPTRIVNYDTASTSCNLIPTDIGDHFSASFTCLKA